MGSQIQPNLMIRSLPLAVLTQTLKAWANINRPLTRTNLLPRLPLSRPPMLMKDCNDRDCVRFVQEIDRIGKLVQ